MTGFSAVGDIEPGYIRGSRRGSCGNALLGLGAVATKSKFPPPAPLFNGLIRRPKIFGDQGAGAVIYCN